MCPHDPSTNDPASAHESIDRRTVLKRTAAASATAGVLSAATGGASAHDLENEVELEALEDGVQFVLKVDGEIEKGEHTGHIDVVYDDRIVVGTIAEDGDVAEYRYSGSIIGFERGGDKVAVTVNGDEVDPDDLSEDDGLLPNKITIEGHDERVEYSIVVTETIEPGRQADIYYDDGVDVDDDDTASGVLIAGDDDTYYYSGAIESLEADGPLSMWIDYE